MENIEAEDERLNFIESFCSQFIQELIKYEDANSLEIHQLRLELEKKDDKIYDLGSDILKLESKIRDLESKIDYLKYIAKEKPE